ncbi:MAG: Small, acid-soluble spore protein A [Firmicutes bacterium ADurb.Bin419]|nr:MAG: Small, acid-soluble spore protein A [Firmicutes bacterium ADurb.Bin419]
MANSNSKKAVPGAENALNKMKYEIASQVGVNLKQGYNGDISAKDAGKVGGNITKKLIQMAEQQLSGK